jgi:NADPH-dependent ferric siderophore reductase
MNFMEFAMNTMNTKTRTPVPVRHQNGLHLAQVVFSEPVSPRMRRITFHAPGLAGFTSAAADDHVKLFFPVEGQSQPALPSPGPRGMEFPEGQPIPPVRDYTPIKFDPKACELTIEFVLHGDGPASHWAEYARPGDWVGIGGPRGSLVIPDDYDGYLLVGDETALPAIARRLEEMPAGTRVIAMIEVADRDEERDLPTAANAQITWLHRNAEPAGTPALLENALKSLSIPAGDIHAWIACEIEVARRLRQYLIEEEGLSRAQIKAAGYWRRGEPGAHASIEE